MRMIKRAAPIASVPPMTAAHQSSDPANTVRITLPMAVYRARVSDWRDLREEICVRIRRANSMRGMHVVIADDPHTSLVIARAAKLLDAPTVERQTVCVQRVLQFIQEREAAAFYSLTRTQQADLKERQQRDDALPDFLRD